MKRSDVAVEKIAQANGSNVASVVASTRSLGLDVLAAFPGETVVTSPASAVVALSMLTTGATGVTEDQIAALLGASGEERDQAINALMGTLDPYRTNPDDINPKKLPKEPALHMANQAVLSDQAEIEQPYLDNLARWFDAGVLTTDLASSEGKKVLDEWVRRNTAGLIEKSAVEPSPELRLVLQNAILFAAQWQVPFKSAYTYEDDFTTASGKRVSAELMGDTRQLQYAEIDGWKMIDLPYGTDGKLVARYVLPPEGVGLESANSERLNSLEDALSPHPVFVTIPKLDLASSLDLIDPLVQRGLTAVFSPFPPALSHISTAEDLFVSLIVQQGRVRVDEEGTVAAAVTEIAVEAGSAPVERPEPVEFRADRPHLVLLLDKTVGWDLFQIAVNDPTAR